MCEQRCSNKGLKKAINTHTQNSKVSRSIEKQQKEKVMFFSPHNITQSSFDDVNRSLR